MSRKTDKEKGKVFDVLHDPARPVYQLGHARRGNTSEIYDSGKIRATGERLLKLSMRAAHGVISGFAKHAKKAR